MEYSITQEDRRQAMACLLNEAADILNEAEARGMRKDAVKDLKSLKKNEVWKSFTKGELSKEDGKKVYDSYKATIMNIRKKVDEIPEETTMEKVASFWRMDFEAKAFVEELGIGFLIGIPAGILSSIGTATYNLGLIYAANAVSYIGGWAGKIAMFKKYRTTKSGEKNWNKAYGERVCDKMEKKLDSIYASKYKYDTAASV